MVGEESPFGGPASDGEEPRSEEVSHEEKPITEVLKDWLDQVLRAVIDIYENSEIDRIEDRRAVVGEVVGQFQEVADLLPPFIRDRMFNYLLVGLYGAIAQIAQKRGLPETPDLEEALDDARRDYEMVRSMSPDDEEKN